MKNKTNIKFRVVDYPVGDFLVKVKNAAMAGNKEVSAQSTKQIVRVAKALEKMGYIENLKEGEKFVSFALTFKNKKPVLMDLKLVSTPGLRIYMGVDEVEDKKGPSTFLISTPKGVLSKAEAIKTRTSGEVIAEIW